MTGACCNTSGTCSVTTSANCTSGGGVYRNNGVACASANCASVTGACCHSNGTCSVRSSANCSSIGGIYRGNGFPCASASCSTPTGACCSAQGGCLSLTPDDCAFFNGAYVGNGVTCEQTDCMARCPLGCESCWIGTPTEGACDPAWEGDGLCDCGCEFVDPDCGPKGACCAPANGVCDVLTEGTCRRFAAGVFLGVGSVCAQADCSRCDAGCDWCWKDTIAEHACLPEWVADGDCDCGCQFADATCATNVCGDLRCSSDANLCPDDCKDLRAFAAFQNCFAPGRNSVPGCAGQQYVSPDGIGLEDFPPFADLLSGP